MTAGSSILNCADCSFSAADIGRQIYVYGASNAQYALSLASSIRAVSDGKTATLADAASQSVSSALVQIIGTNDTKAVLLARRAACRVAERGSKPVALSFPSGVYAMDKHIEPCSNLRITGGGTILQTTIVPGDAAGQGSSVIVFPRSPTGRWCDGGTMTAGSNVLKYGEQGEHPCNFSPADVGSRVAVEYGGPKYLTLYASIQKYVSPTQVVLDQPAGTSVPVTKEGFDKVGTSLQIGTTPITNVQIDHITLMNVSTAYTEHPHLGVGIVAFGADPTSIKQTVRVNNVRVITASANCLGGNNGFLDQFWFEDNTLIGCADAAMYVAGWSTRGVIANNTIENVDFPGLPPKVIGRTLHNGILVKGAADVVFENNTININAIQAGMTFGDHTEFLDRVENNHIKVMAQYRSALGIKGNFGAQLQISGNDIECDGEVSLGVFFYSNRVSDIEVSGNTIRHCRNGVKFEAGEAGAGPSNIRVKNNRITGCQDGIRFESLSGVNVIAGNRLTGCAGLPWLVMSSEKGSVTYLSADNDAGGSANLPFYDRSVKRLGRGVKPPN